MRIMSTGSIATFSSLLEALVAWMLNFCRSCTISPQKRLNVRGSRTCKHIIISSHVGSEALEPDTSTAS